MLRRVLWFVFFTILVTACGENEPTSVWPARLSGFKNFTSNQEESVGSAILNFNSHLGQEALSADAPEGSLAVTFKIVEPSKEHPKRMGFATLTEESCSIDLNKDLFKKELKDLLEIVVWHELGHCAGKGHDTTQGEIMYKSAEKAGSYSSESIERFFKSLLKATRFIN